MTRCAGRERSGNNFVASDLSVHFMGVPGTGLEFSGLGNKSLGLLSHNDGPSPGFLLYLYAQTVNQWLGVIL